MSRRCAIRWSDIQFDPPPRTLRQFAGLWLAFFGGLSAFQFLGRGNTLAGTISGVLALAIGLPGLARPRLLRPVYVAWMVLAFPIGWTISQVIVAVMFYGLFLPIGLVFRLIGRDALHRTRRPGVESYWAPKVMPTDPGRYFKQF